MKTEMKKLAMSLLTLLSMSALYAYFGLTPSAVAQAHPKFQCCISGHCVSCPPCAPGKTCGCTIVGGEAAKRLLARE